jgi:hypothetical protein
MTLLIIGLIVLAVAALLAQPMVRRVLAARILRPMGRVRARAGLQTPRAVAHQAVRELKAKSAVMVDHSYLPTQVIVHLSTPEYEEWRAVLESLARDIETLLQQAATPDARTREASRFSLLGRPHVQIEPHDDLLRGHIAVDASFGDDAVRELETIQIAHRVREEAGDSTEGIEHALRVQVDDQARNYPVRGDLIIGRDPAADVHIDDGRISRRHARVSPAEPGVTITDLGSRNGTWVAGRRVDGSVVARAGTEIEFGGAVAATLVDIRSEP